MAKSFRNRMALTALALPLALSACGRGEEKAADNSGTMNASEAAEALDAAMNEQDGALPGEAPPQGELIPPAPGEEGGLPDDRTPLNESAARNPASVEASGNTIQLWGLALAEGRYRDAYRLWGGEGRQSGMNEAQFAEAYRKYSEIHVLVGRPEAGGTQTARVPVQMYGRLRDGGKPFNLVGTMTLARNPAGQKGEPGQTPWLIATSELKPRGTVRVSASGGDPARMIPASFQGRWSRSAAACAQPGDDSRLAIQAGEMVFYESVGKVKQIQIVGPREINVTADYEGEGERWTRTMALRLTETDKVLSVDGMKRVRCA